MFMKSKWVFVISKRFCSLSCFAGGDCLLQKQCHSSSAALWMVIMDYEVGILLVLSA